MFKRNLNRKKATCLTVEMRKLQHSNFKPLYRENKDIRNDPKELELLFPSFFQSPDKTGSIRTEPLTATA